MLAQFEDFNLLNTDATAKEKLSPQNLSLDFVMDNCNFVCKWGLALSLSSVPFR